ncbi:MAG: major facilitator superfamily 1 [Deltaproteobacteria bacterium]|nr:major facilitator superfamily 1 [Deltaproteobacteria bacterium]
MLVKGGVPESGGNAALWPTQTLCDIVCPGAIPPQLTRTGGRTFKKESVVVFITLSAIYTFSMFYRVSSAVIAPDLMAEFHLTAESIGLLSGAFFYSFAILQIPAGPILDRIGPRIVLTFSALVGAGGALLFGIAHSFSVALAARLLMGFGMASMLMGCLKVFTLRFSPDAFASLSGLIIAVGTIGNVLAASPLAYVASRIGWRMTFVLCSLTTALLAAAVFWALKERTVGGNKKTSPPAGEVPAMRITARLILGSLAFWQLGAVAFFRYGTYVSLQGIWLGLYLMDAKGYTPVQAGNVLAMLAIGMTVGSPIAGYLSDKVFRTRKSVALAGFALYTLSLAPLIGILDIDSVVWYALLAFCVGFFSGFGMLAYSHGKALFPPEISGTVMTWVNFFVIAGGAVLISVLGKIIEQFPHKGTSYPAVAYHVAFLACFASMAASTLFYAFSQKDS